MIAAVCGPSIRSFIAKHAFYWSGRNVSSAQKEARAVEAVATLVTLRSFPVRVLCYVPQAEGVLADAEVGDWGLTAYWAAIYGGT